MLTAIQIGAMIAFVLAWVQMGWVDWTEQKIRNQFLSRWLACVLVGYAALAVDTMLGERGLVSQHVLWPYYAAALAHVAVSAAAGYVLWILRVWPAGDVKLFVLLALYYPLMRLPASFHSGLRFLEVLINVFIPAAAFLFLTAGRYLWRTRFQHQSEFLASLGPARWASYLAQKIRVALPAMRAEAAAGLRTLRQPRAVALGALSWFASVFVMAMISYFLGDLIRSDFAKTLVCFALFFLWSRFSAEIGRERAMALAFVALAALFAFAPAIRWSAFARVLGDISVFSLCIFFGVQVAFKLVAGQTGYAFLPLLFMLPSLIPWRRLFALLDPSWSVPAAPSGLAAAAVWGAMGLFFGSSLVFVRIWDAESYKSVRPRDVAPFMNLGPAFVEKLREDPEFFSEHFDTLYADGLTRDQVAALRVWCEARGVAVVPLAPTISFANWIFLGYILTWALDGHVLRAVYG